MKAPLSKGIGSGLAQVIDMSGVANAYAQGQVVRAQQEVEAQRKAQKKIDELRGRMDDVLKTDIFYSRDKDELLNRYNQLRSKYEGRWEKVYHGNTPEAREYNNDVFDLYTFAGKSKEDKLYAKELLNDMTAHPEKYDDEDKKMYVDFINNPNSDRPTIIGAEPVDIEKAIQENVVAPLKTLAVDRKKSVSWDNPTSGGSSTKIQVTEDERNAQLKRYWDSDPQFQRYFAKVNKQKIMEGADPYQLYVQTYYPSTEINITDVDSRVKDQSGSGDVEAFNPSNIIDNYEYKRAGDKVYGGKTYQTKAVKSNAPMTVNTFSVEGKPVRGAEAGEITYSYPTAVYVDKNGVPLPKGKTSDRKEVMVFGEGWVGDNRTTIVRPFEEVKDAFKEKGYDVDAIEQNLLGSSKSTKKSINRSDISTKAKQAGYSTAEYEKLLKQNGIEIIE